MSSQGSFGANFLFQSINDDLNASLATADELSKEFSSLLKEASSSSSSSSSSNNIKNTTPASQSSSTIPKELLQPYGASRFSNTLRPSGSDTNGNSISSSISSSSSKTISSSSLPYFHSTDSSKSSSSSSSRNVPLPQALSQSPHSSPKSQKRGDSPMTRFGSDSYLYKPQGAHSPPAAQAPASPSFYDRSSQTSFPYGERGPPPNVRTGSMDRIPYPTPSNLLNPYDDGGNIGRRPPRTDKNPSPLSFSPSATSTLPRNFTPFRQSDEVVQRKKNPGKWSETDLDMSYDRKPHHTYDKSEWLRPAVPKSNWRESNLDGPPPASIPKQPQQMSYGSLNRPTRTSVPPDAPSSAQSPYRPQSISSRVTILPNINMYRHHKPIPLSVILRLQNPYQEKKPLPLYIGGEADRGLIQPPQREYVPQPPVQVEQQAPGVKPPAAYSDVLNFADVDAELEGLEYQPSPGNPETPSIPGDSGEVGLPVPPVPRPLSPTRLQPVVAPEAPVDEIPDREELLRIRAEIPRALKRRGAVELSEPPPQIPQNQPNQYKNLINKLFRKRGRRHKEEQSSDGSISSDDEGGASVPTPTSAPVTPTLGPQEAKNYRSILRRPGRKNSGRRAHLSPLVLLLDGALVGELETVQKAVQEMTDPSQPNDEGITGLHNAICGGHYNVVEFLVRIGANVSAPDSHGWTPLHCAASCNDLDLCQFLVRNGAAVMAVTERDNATAAQKCDPYTQGYEECESFLRGVEEIMGVDNSGVLYALWSYPAQAPDELSFKEGDMVTILHKPEGSAWWCASLCGREGFVPNNYFGLFPKVRPKSLC